jgi:hypothetical protein
MRTLLGVPAGSPSIVPRMASILVPTDRPTDRPSRRGRAMWDELRGCIAAGVDDAGGGTPAVRFAAS